MWFATVFPMMSVCRLLDEDPEPETLNTGEENVTACQQYQLPSRQLNGIWERCNVNTKPCNEYTRLHKRAFHFVAPSVNSIIVDELIKEHLLSHATTSMLFADSQVDSNLISWNKYAFRYSRISDNVARLDRVMLLHGPPGTGKTSLCKGLAQKLSVRLSHVYTSAQLIEVNAHGLFSKVS
jgi:Cdc6-like AAA superfamily ATPase